MKKEIIASVLFFVLIIFPCNAQDLKNELKKEKEWRWNIEKARELVSILTTPQSGNTKPLKWR
ncbi:MAG: hypothetical protein OIF50_10045 [Flavobacteriaceae bacterium]|nr:hypothetical protein [Flavobacteriaceae bacterium]